MIHLDKIAAFSKENSGKMAVYDRGNFYSWYDIEQNTIEKVSFLHSFIDFSVSKKRACFISENSMELVCWMAAFSTLGVATNGLDYTLPLADINQLIEQIQPDILLIAYYLYDKETLSKIKNPYGRIQFIGSPSDVIIKSIVLDEDGHISSDEDHCLMSLTSGTTALPKIAIRKKSFDKQRFDYFINQYHFSEKDAFLAVLPFYHAAGNGWARLFMARGAGLFIVDQNDLDEMVSVINTYLISTAVLTPHLMDNLLHHLKNQTISSSFRWILVGGSYFPATLKKAALQAFGDVIYEYYGSTESGINTIASPCDLLYYPNSVGRAFEGNEICIVNQDNQPLLPHQIGRVAVSSYMLMDEYCDGSQPFIELVDKGRFLLMMDQGYLDEENRLYLVSRGTELKIKLNVYHLEEVIRALPFVKDVAFLSFQQNQINIIKCIYEVYDDLLEDENEVSKQIDRIGKRNGDIYFEAKQVGKIPYSPSGKVRTTQIAQLFNVA